MHPTCATISTSTWLTGPAQTPSQWLLHTKSTSGTQTHLVSKNWSILANATESLQLHGLKRVHTCQWEHMTDMFRFGMCIRRRWCEPWLVTCTESVRVPGQALWWPVAQRTSKFLYAMCELSPISFNTYEDTSKKCVACDGVRMTIKCLHQVAMTTS